MPKAEMEVPLVNVVEEPNGHWRSEVYGVMKKVRWCTARCDQRLLACLVRTRQCSM